MGYDFCGIFSVNTITCGDILMSTLTIFLSNAPFIFNVAVLHSKQHSRKIKRTVISYLWCLFSWRSKPKTGVASKTQLEYFNIHFLRFFYSVGCFLFFTKHFTGKNCIYGVGAGDRTIEKSKLWLCILRTTWINELLQRQYSIAGN